MSESPRSVDEAFSGALVAPGYFTKESPIGDAITGVITATTMQFRRERGQIVRWDGDGTPQENFIVTLQTDLHQDEKDDGLRSVYIKWWGEQKKAIAKAVADAKRSAPQIGDTLTVTYVADGPQPADKSLSPEKQWSYVYTAGSSAAAAAPPAETPATA